ncbi:hypothetical protein [Paenibacillus lemnae]|nr:hypothetical protein [Paenibacillus lemnae]
MRRTKIGAAFITSLMLSLALATAASADSSTHEPFMEPGALTPPPPVEYNTMSVNQSNVYLAAIESSLFKNGTIQFTISASTNANSIVDSLGVNYTLQRWNGSAWVDNGTDAGQVNNSQIYSGNKQFSALTGYYYRGRTVHWIKKGTINEERTAYTETILR